MNNFQEFNSKIDQAVWAILDAKIIAYQNGIPWNMELILNEVTTRVHDLQNEAARLLRENKL